MHTDLLLAELGLEGRAGSRAAERADGAPARGERRGATKITVARAGHDRELADGRRQGDPEPSLGSGRARRCRPAFRC